MAMLMILLLMMIQSTTSALPTHRSGDSSGLGMERPPSIALVPSKSSSQHPTHGFAAAPLNLNHGPHPAWKQISAPEPISLHHSPNNIQQGPSLLPLHSTSPSTTRVAPSPKILSKQLTYPALHPAISPLGLSMESDKFMSPPPPQTFSLSPPNEDCTLVTCTEPQTYTPPGSACGCVWPIQVKLSLEVALYTFFPLVSELSNEIAASVSLYPHQVRIMGANAATQQPEKTILLIDLVPLGEIFDSATAFGIYDKFLQKQSSMLKPPFGAYEVLSVSYSGLPKYSASPPPNTGTGLYSGHANNGMTMKPLGVDVRSQKGDGFGGRAIAVIVLVSSIAFVVCMGVALFVLLKAAGCIHQSEHILHDTESMPRKPSGAVRSMALRSKTGSTSMFSGSSVQSYTGSARAFGFEDMERITANFDDSRILGEGGFGLVYSGALEDGRKVAVKVIKRDDRQGSREFFAEVEMLSRLHHRNIVQLIGICDEDFTRCLVYELVPSGSVESHLHGIDNAQSLGWGDRMKIALGAARGLAYLHEDSSPCVIHGDFKSGNILLEHDFTPKVSDFGLARIAMDENNTHISTHVMGTFGYLAPEYAMTGHLLVKSDVYSYGVVLLELLTGRKPVDLSQPPGQENLVAWARPLLTRMEGLNTIVDPMISRNTSFDSIAKVAAIASMCVQPEASHRPFMSEVVQALKLVCNELHEETREEGQRKDRQEESFSMEMEKAFSATDLRSLLQQEKEWNLGHVEGHLVLSGYDRGQIAILGEGKRTVQRLCE